MDAVVVARDYNISRATLYNWKSKYSGVEISQVKRLTELEDEFRCYVFLDNNGIIVRIDVQLTSHLETGISYFLETH